MAGEKTTYIVLRLDDGVGVGETWDVVATIDAHSAAAAIREHVATAKGGGTFNAVPDRSWKPTRVAVETQTVIKLGDTG